MSEELNSTWIERELDGDGVDIGDDPALPAELARQRRVHLLLTAHLDLRARDQAYAVIRSAISGSRRERIAQAIGRQAGRQMRRQRPTPPMVRRLVWLAAALVLVALGAWGLLPAPVPGPEALADHQPATPKQDIMAEVQLVTTSPGLSLRRAGHDQPAVAGLALQPGDSLLAPAIGTELGYADGSRVRLAAGTQLDFLPVDQGKRLHLAAGGISASVAIQPAGAPLQISGKSARAEVVGTIFTLVEEPLGTRLQVDEGLVRLHGTGAVLDVPAGSQGLATRQGTLVAFTPFSTAGLETRLSDGFESLAAWNIKLGGRMERTIVTDAPAEGKTCLRLEFRHHPQEPGHAFRGRELALTKADRAFRFRLRVERADPGAEFLLQVRASDGDVWTLAQWPVAAGGGWRTVLVPIPAPGQAPSAKESPVGHWQAQQMKTVFFGAEHASLSVSVDQLEVLEQRP